MAHASPRPHLGPAGLYAPALGLLADLYQLTMAQAYWASGTANKEAVFHLFFRRCPFANGYAISCGLASVIDHLARLHFDADDLAYLKTISGNDGRPLFDPAFVDTLGADGFRCDVDAIPDGTVVFPNEPLVRVRGPIMHAQIVETALLTLMNYETLVATKAARICQAAGDDPVIEFGLRRAQGIDGGLSASRAAYIGGCIGTSNVLAGRLFDIPVRGTHAHSWVMSFDSELESFEAYARALPNNCVFLVDTYDTIAGVRHAIAAGRSLRKRGHEMVGIRLDSGDLAYLSIEARRLLDEAGFADTTIVASNDLDEHVIASLKQQHATIAVWGVGTRLVTGHDEAALGGVYKLAAIREPGADWAYRIKISEQRLKITTPGMLQVRRFDDGEFFRGDAIMCELRDVDDEVTIVDPNDPTRFRTFDPRYTFEDLLVPIFRAGEQVYETPSIHASRDRAAAQLGRLHPGIRRLLNPHEYPVGAEAGLDRVKTDMIRALREELRR